jgi:YfiH family protein
MHNFEYVPVFKESKSLVAGFTLKNPSYITQGSNIVGLNIGLNKLENHKIVHNNRKQFFNSIGISENQITSASQIHSSNICYSQKGGEIIQGVDGLYTNKRGICLLIQVADCAPVILCDESNNLIAVVHAGWRGAAAGILTKMIDSMIELGSDINKVKMAIGPCIGFENFEVGKEVVEVFPEEFSKAKTNGKYLLDLKGFLEYSALSVGLQTQNIEISPLCSVSNIESCYSHRREGEKAGRMGGFIYIKPQN